MEKRNIKLRTHKDFKKYLNQEHILYSKLSDGYLCIDIEDGIHFDGVTMLPPKVRFSNEGELEFDSLESLPRFCEFENFERGDITFFKLKNMPSETKFENRGDIDFMALDSIPGGIVFNNGGDVNFRRDIKSFGDSIVFNNGYDVNMKCIYILNKFIEFNNGGNVCIGKVSRIAHNYRFSNYENVNIGVESMGEAVVFGNEGNVRIKGLRSLPKRTKFWSRSVELPDVVEINSRNAFNNCGYLSIPTLDGFSKGVRFNVEGEITIGHISYIARDVKFEHYETRGGKHIIHLSGGSFYDGVIVTANSLSESIKSNVDEFF